MPYIENGLPFTIFAFFARPVLAYHKLNTRICSEWSTQRENSIAYLANTAACFNTLQGSSIDELAIFLAVCACIFFPTTISYFSPR